MVVVLFVLSCGPAESTGDAEGDGSGGEGGAAVPAEAPVEEFVPYADGWTFTFGPSLGATQLVPTESGYAFFVAWASGEINDSEGATVPHTGGPFVAELGADRTWLQHLPVGIDASGGHFALLANGQFAVVAARRASNPDPTWVPVQDVSLTVYQAGADDWSDDWQVTTTSGTNLQVAALDDGTFVVRTAEVEGPVDDAPDPAAPPEWTTQLRHYAAEGTLLADTALPDRLWAKMASAGEGEVYILSREAEDNVPGSICLERRRASGEQLWESCFGTAYDEPGAVLALADGGAAVLVNHVFAADTDEDFDAHPERTLFLQPQEAGYFQNGSALVLLDASGTLLRASLIYATYDMVASALVEDSKGTLYVGGTTRGDGMLFEHGWLTYSDDLFVARFTPAGVAQGVRVWGGIGVEVLQALAVDEDDSLLAAGYFTDRVNFGQGGGTDIRIADTEPNGSAFITKFRFYPEQVAEYPQVTCEPLPVTYIAADFADCHARDSRAQRSTPCAETYFEGDPGYEECLEYGTVAPASDDTSSSCSVTYNAFSCP